MALSDRDKQIAYSIVAHLQSQVNSGRLSEEQSEGVSVAVQCLSEAYGVDLEDQGQRDKYAADKTLEELFPAVQPLGEDDKARADALKQKGNAQLKLNKIDDAISLYSQAIDIDSNNATFYCNRAAAYIKKDQYQEALDDCKKAVEIDPEYARAHGRMGYIYSVQNRFPEAKDCFQKAIQLDPANASYKGNLDAVVEQERVASSQQGGGAKPGGGGAPGGGAQGMGAPGGIGGMLGGGLASLFQNPGFMNMATSMMQNPTFQSMASRMMQNGPPNPQNMAEMMPEMVQAARQMQQENPELFENLQRQMPQFNPTDDSPSGDPPKDKDSSDSKDQ